MRNDFESNYLAHWGLKKGAQKDKHKYVARVELPDGKYRYFYTLAEYAAYLKDEAKNAWDNKEKIMEDKLNEGVKKAEGLYNKINKENKYMTDDYNYDRKIEQIKNTKEWQDIVKRNDPEYTKINKETGEKTYDIDSYLAKKKHPGLDAADDIIMGRPVKLNKLDKEALTAGAADYGKTYVTMAAIGTKFLLEKFKFSQGSYKEEKQAAYDYATTTGKNAMKTANQASTYITNENAQKVISEGEKYVSKAMQEYGNSQVADDLSYIKNSVSKEDYDAMKKEYESYKKDYEAMQKELEKYKKSKA